MLSAGRSLLALLLATATTFAAAHAVTPDTQHIIWRNPGLVDNLDLKWGMGGPDRAPRPPFTFIDEDTSGTKPKVRVKDSVGVTWTVKLIPPKTEQNEVHAEIAASRIVWALGYCADENYFVPAGKIEGAANLKRAATAISPDGTFEAARFERMPDHATKSVSWQIEANRFKGTRELAGLHMLMMILGNWDLRNTNTWIYRVTPPGNPNTEERYVVTDLGSTFGRMKGGADKAPTRWNLEDYRNARYVHGLVAKNVLFEHPLTGNAPLQVPIEHVRWFLSLATRLTPAQLQQAFDAAGATTAEGEGFSAEFLKRVAALNAVAGSAK